MDVRRQKRRRIAWGRWLILTIIVSLLAIGTYIWILNDKESWTTVLPAVLFAVLGVLLALFQWLFPVSNDAPEAAHPMISTHTSVPAQQLVEPSVLPSQIIVQVPSQPLSQPLVAPIPPINQISYRSILGMPPPTDARTIQQRERVVYEVYERLTQQDITALVLTGIGGVGKSTLAALVYQYAELQRRQGKGLFTDQALWLKIDSFSVTMVDLVSTIFAALGKPVPDISHLAPQNQAATLFNVLNEIESARLIVLDQFENLLDWQTGYALPDHPGIGEWLDALNSQPALSRVLLTSRPWPLGTRSYAPTYMQEYRVGGLETTEGVALLRKLAVQGTDEELALAVKRCAGHAFALTLLASLLRTRNITLSAFFKDTSYEQVWSGNVARNLLDSIFTQQLDQLQRQVLLAFSVYREPVPVEAVWAMAEFPSRALVQQSLDALLAQHLLQPSGDGKYQLHAIVTAYAREHLVPDDEQANEQAWHRAHIRAAQYYVDFERAHCPGRGRRRHLQDVQPLIEAVWHYGQGLRWQVAYEVIVQEDLFGDLHRWGLDTILLELYQVLLPPERWLTSQVLLAHFYDELGTIYRVLGRLEQARDTIEKALSYCRLAGAKAEEGVVLNNIGRVYSFLGRKQEALDGYKAALRIHREVGNRSGEATSLTHLGWSYYDFGQLEDVQECYEQALQIRRELQDRVGEATVLNSLGRLYVIKQQLQEAQRCHEQALSICREIGDRSGEGWTLNNLGRLYGQLGNAVQAREWYRQAIAIRHEIGDRRGESATLNNLGLLVMNMGELEQALQLFHASLLLRREVGHLNGEAKTLTNLGIVYEKLEQYAEASEYLRAALRIRWQLRAELGYTKREGEALLYLGLCFLRQQQYEQALTCLLAAIENFDRSRPPDYRAAQLRIIASRYLDDLHQATGDATFVVLEHHVRPRVQQLIAQPDLSLL